MPTEHLRMNATWPLAVLTLTDAGLRIELRALVRWIGGVSLSATPGDLTRVFPTYRLWTHGVGFTDRRGRDWYFWTGQDLRILAVLHQRGYPVTNQRQKARKVWQVIP